MVLEAQKISHESCSCFSIPPGRCSFNKWERLHIGVDIKARTFVFCSVTCEKDGHLILAIMDALLGLLQALQVVESSQALALQNLSWLMLVAKTC